MPPEYFEDMLFNISLRFLDRFAKPPPPPAKRRPRLDPKTSKKRFIKVFESTRVQEFSQTLPCGPFGAGRTMNLSSVPWVLWSTPLKCGLCQVWAIWILGWAFGVKVVLCMCTNGIWLVVCPGSLSLLREQGAQDCHNMAPKIGLKDDQQTFHKGV